MNEAGETAMMNIRRMQTGRKWINVINNKLRCREQDEDEEKAGE